MAKMPVRGGVYPRSPAPHTTLVSPPLNLSPPESPPPPTHTQMSVKRKQAESEAVAIEGDDSDDPERVEHDRMAS
eukprot:7385157-Prymnesium_polylepis.1